MTLRIEFYIVPHGASYWLDFDIPDEYRAASAFLDKMTRGNARDAGETPFYLIEREDQWDAFHDFRRELARARPAVGTLG